MVDVEITRVVERVKDDGATKQKPPASKDNSHRERTVPVDPHEAEIQKIMGELAEGDDAEPEVVAASDEVEVEVEDEPDTHDAPETDVVDEQVQAEPEDEQVEDEPAADLADERVEVVVAAEPVGPEVDEQRSLSAAAQATVLERMQGPRQIYEAPKVLQSPQEILQDRYGSAEPIAEGAFREVYRVESKTGKIQAVKVLSPDLEGEAYIHAGYRLDKEARIMNEMHQDLPDHFPSYVLELNQEGLHGVTMEYGIQSLKDRVEQSGGLSADEALKALSQMVTILDHLRSNGIRNCDIKPNGFCFNTRGNLMVVDLDLVEIDEADNIVQDRSIVRSEAFSIVANEGKVVGTLDYMAPERKKGMGPSEQSEVYELAVNFYELLTNEVPGLGWQDELVGEKKNFVDVLKVAFDKDPEERFSNSSELLEALRQAASGESSLDSVTTPLERIALRKIGEAETDPELRRSMRRAETVADPTNKEIITAITALTERSLSRQIAHHPDSEPAIPWLREEDLIKELPKLELIDDLGERLRAIAGEAIVRSSDPWGQTGQRAQIRMTEEYVHELVAPTLRVSARARAERAKDSALAQETEKMAEQARVAIRDRKARILSDKKNQEILSAIISLTKDYLADSLRRSDLALSDLPSFAQSEIAAFNPKLESFRFIANKYQDLYHAGVVHLNFTYDPPKVSLTAESAQKFGILVGPQSKLQRVSSDLVSSYADEDKRREEWLGHQREFAGKLLSANSLAVSVLAKIGENQDNPDTNYTIRSNKLHAHYGFLDLPYPTRNVMVARTVEGEGWQTYSNDSRSFRNRSLITESISGVTKQSLLEAFAIREHESVEKLMEHFMKRGLIEGYIWVDNNGGGKGSKCYRLTKLGQQVLIDFAEKKS